MYQSLVAWLLRVMSYDTVTNFLAAQMMSYGAVISFLAAQGDVI